MTITIEIECDGCGKHEQTSSDHDSAVNEIDGVLDPGWVHTSTEDYCPDCAEEHEND